LLFAWLLLCTILTRPIQITKGFATKSATNPTQTFLRKDKGKHSTDQFKDIPESFADLSRELSGPSQNFAGSFIISFAELSERNDEFAIQSLSEKTRDEASKVYCKS
jgi:hypothetical protein